MWRRGRPQQQQGGVTHREIISQPSAWEGVLQELRGQAARLQAVVGQDWAEVVFIGSGSSHHAALSAASTFQRVTGIRSRAASSSSVFLDPHSVLSANGSTLLVALSRSGETTETLRALDRFRREGVGSSLAFCCTEGSALIKAADTAVTLPIDEEGVVSTKSFTALLLSASVLALLAVGDVESLDRWKVAVELCRGVLELEKTAVEAARQQNLVSCTFLGAGPFYGIAREGKYKMQQIARVDAAAHLPLEYRHGPMAAVSPSTLVVGLISTEPVYEVEMLRSARQAGGRTLALGVGMAPPNVADWQVVLGGASKLRHAAGLPESSTGEYNVLWGQGGDYVGTSRIPPGWDDGLHAPRTSQALTESLMSLLYAVGLQLLAFHKALDRGLDPDQPRLLERVVQM